MLVARASFYTHQGGCVLLLLLSSHNTKHPRTTYSEYMRSTFSESKTAGFTSFSRRFLPHRQEARPRQLVTDAMSQGISNRKQGYTTRTKTNQRLREYNSREVDKQPLSSSFTRRIYFVYFALFCSCRIFLDISEQSRTSRFVTL